MELIKKIFTNRVRFTFFIFSIFLLEDILECVGPHSILGDIWGIVSFLFIIGGLLLRSWAAGILKKEKELATTGPYAIMRHPLYFGSFLLAVGFCMKIGDVENIWLVLVLALFVYYPKIKLEERILSRKFSDMWNYYVSQTAMFFPRRLFLLKLRSDWKLNVWIKNREYNAVLGAFVGLLVTEIIHYMFPYWTAH